ncbi:hypothetical protein B0J15DRAFT_460923 [Fusarium solani]|uniref:Secreted protein n=1 Tax=Fusarium solani TaxID=169388 RepID=A0A9P9L3B7_FUSSL|nr:uncharacterized protein B0J15DRAFT_460923 [Fusarium solani]KAH7273213.1 hypothetical protein B0J15DRAFT_460923 [Fusarium solani]
MILVLLALGVTRGRSFALGPGEGAAEALVLLASTGFFGVAREGPPRPRESVLGGGGLAEARLEGVAGCPGVARDTSPVPGRWGVLGGTLVELIPPFQRDSLSDGRKRRFWNEPWAPNAIVSEALDSSLGMDHIYIGLVEGTCFFKLAVNVVLS